MGLLTTILCCCCGGRWEHRGGFAWFANADLSRGSSAPSDTFRNRRLASESDFEIAGVEVWGFVTKR